MMNARLSAQKDREEFIEVINNSDLSQDEADTLVGLFDNVIQSYEVEKRLK